MHTSGQFAGMFRVSKKLLRHYHEIGLLIPATIDSANGYAYYEQPQIERMKKILYLRALHISLNDIGCFLDTPEKERHEKIRGHLFRIRAEQRSLDRIESELISIDEKLKNGADLFSFAGIKTEFTMRVFHLDAPIYVIGRAVRIVHGSPEHGPAIEALISDYFGDDITSIIPNRKEPAARFGICAEFTPETREFTYIMGDRTSEQIKKDKLPESTRSYEIPAGYYACVTFSAPDIETITRQTLGEGYGKLFDWLGNSEEWVVSTVGGTVAYEVYEDERFEVPSYPEMDIWTPVSRKENS